MRWAERQVALLREMGVRLWLPQVPLATAPEVAATPVNPATHAAPLVRAKVSTVAAAAPEPSPNPAERPPVRPSPGPGPVAVAALSRSAPIRPVLASPAALDRSADAVPKLDLGWTELRAAVAACTACALHTGRRQTVFGVGLERADWMVIGEAPGDAEDIEGVPFVGRAGQLLDNMLQAIGLTRGAAATPAQQVYIANAVKCRPPGTRSPSAAELAQCEGFLLRQVQLLQPRIILAMGPTAVQHLLRSKEPIGKLRGRVHDYHGVPLIVTYHPTYLLRHLEDKARVWDDLCLAVQTLK